MSAMNDNAEFVAQVRKIVPECDGAFMADLLAACDKIARAIELDNKLKTFDKPQILDTFSEMQDHLEACIKAMEGRFRTLRLGTDYLNQSLYEEYFDSGKADGHWLGYEAGLLNLRRVRDAVIEAQLNVETDLPIKPLKMGLRTAAEQVCTLLKAHGYGNHITGYDQGLACRLISLIMDNLHSPRGMDSYRKEVAGWLHTQRATADPQYKAKEKFIKAIDAAIKGKPLPK